MSQSRSVTVLEHVDELHEEAVRTNQRRLLILSGDRATTDATLYDLLESISIGISDTVVVSTRLDVRCNQIDPRRSIELMGTEAELVVMDLHERLVPNALGRCVGAAAGGGLIVLCTPPLSVWPELRDGFDRSMVVEPYTLDDVTGHFRRRLVETLHDQEGISIIDTDDDAVVRSGLTGKTARPQQRGVPPPPADAFFPKAAYRQCRTADQRRVLHRLEVLADPSQAVVITADRGRGKSSVAGLAAGACAAMGFDVAVTAPEPSQVRPLLDRAMSLLARLDESISDMDLPPGDLDIETTAGGRLRWYRPAELVDNKYAGQVDLVCADEAAGVPVPTLRALLEVPRAVFTTTLHGYEGTGQGFETRFRNALEAVPHAVTELTMSEPIRYAPHDPIERWLNRVLLLDATPAAEESIQHADVNAVSIRHLSATELIDDPALLDDIVGLLAMAHYRTEPDDIARLLDAPNLSVAALLTHGQVCTVALLADEGPLPPEVREATYHGKRLRGNMVPDIFISDYQSVSSAATAGVRIVRIATHPALQRRGFASRLLTEIQETASTERAWIAAGFGGTAGLVRFWTKNGFVPLFLATTRNERSGAYSVVMIRELTDAGTRVIKPLTGRFPARLAASLSDIHDGVEPAVIRSIFRAVDHPVSGSLSEDDWRFIANVAFGPGRYDLDPRPVRELALRYFSSPRTERASLSDLEETILIAKVLQCRSWPSVTDLLGLASIRITRQTLGDAIATLAIAYGGRVLKAEQHRLSEEFKTNRHD